MRRVFGTVAHQACGDPTGGDGIREIRLVHPTGTLRVEVDASGNGEARVASARVTLTARTIMRGAVIVPT